jgi:hypothetical protein
MKRIPDSTVETIKLRIAQGVSSRKIAAELGVAYASVNRVRRESCPDTPVSLGGRPSCLSSRDRRALSRIVTSGEADTAVAANRIFAGTIGKQVSDETVRTALKIEGMKAVVKKKKPFLSRRHKKARYDFALKYKDWTTADWSTVIFSDETKVNRFGSDGRNWVWKSDGGPITERLVQGTVKFGGGSLMLWGCITSQGVGFACRIDGRMDAELYTRILGGELLNTLRHYGMNKGNIIFQQDNDPKHTSKLATRWFASNEITLLDWPAQSPDLNPIEHAWDYLKRKLAAYETVPTGILELWSRVEKEWEAIPADFCRDLIYSMPRRVGAVLKTRGGYTKY